MSYVGDAAHAKRRLGMDSWVVAPFETGRSAARYSLAVCTGYEMKIIKGDLDPAHISTSYVNART